MRSLGQLILGAAVLGAIVSCESAPPAPCIQLRDAVSKFCAESLTKAKCTEDLRHDMELIVGDGTALICLNASQSLDIMRQVRELEEKIRR